MLIRTLPSWINKQIESSEIQKLFNAIISENWINTPILLESLGDSVRKGFSGFHPFWTVNYTTKPTSATFDGVPLQYLDSIGGRDLFLFQPSYTWLDGTCYLFDLEVVSVALNSASGTIDLAVLWDDIVVGSLLKVTNADNSVMYYDYLYAAAGGQKIQSPEIGPVSLQYRSNNKKNQIENLSLIVTLDGTAQTPIFNYNLGRWKDTASLYTGVSPDINNAFVMKQQSQKVAFSYGNLFKIAGALNISDLKYWTGSAWTGSTENFDIHDIPQYAIGTYSNPTGSAQFEIPHEPECFVVISGTEILPESAYSISGRVITITAVDYINPILVRYTYKTYENPITSLTYGSSGVPQLTLSFEGVTEEPDETVRVTPRWGEPVLTGIDGDFV